MLDFFDVMSVDIVRRLDLLSLLSDSFCLSLDRFQLGLCLLGDLRKTSLQYGAAPPGQVHGQMR
jgi:hypothetical protein